MSLPAPYWQDDYVTLYHGDALTLLPLLQADCIITDPPYGETSLDWDRWPDGWPELAARVARQMWCFGSMRMFFEKRDDLCAWKLAQEIVWEKHNGSSFHNDRFRRVHEYALHFYQGEWSTLYRDVPRIGPHQRRQHIKRGRTPHLGTAGASAVIDGQRIMPSVIFVNSCHGEAVHPTQKPEGIVAPLLMYSVAEGGCVLDPFAGSGTTLAVARKNGRRAIGIEAREEYCRVIIDRFAQRELAV